VVVLISPPPCALVVVLVSPPLPGLPAPLPPPPGPPLVDAPVEVDSVLALEDVSAGSST